MAKGTLRNVAGRAKGAGLIAAGVSLAAANAVLACKLAKLDAHVRRTNAGLARVYTVRDAEAGALRVLNVGGVYQSATYLDERWHEPAFAYYRAFDHMFEAEANMDENTDAGAGEAADEAASVSGADAATDASDAAVPFAIRDVLMIGGGGCAWPKHAVMTHPNVSVDVVESDPAIAELARRYFFVDELERTLREREGSARRFNLMVDDGLGYLAGCEKHYDAICNDAFSGKTAAADLASAAGIRAVKDHLNDGGLYLVNAVSDSRWHEFRHVIRLINELDRQFSHVSVIFAADEHLGAKDNYLVVASDADYTFSDVIPYEQS